MGYYPVAFKMFGRKALVIGGGRVASQKIKKLLEAGSKVKVISPGLGQDLIKLVSRKKISWLRRGIKKDDLNQASIVIAATNDNKVNKKVSAWARARKIPVNVVDNSALSDFISPAVFLAKKAVVAVYTNGRDPAFSRDLKNFIRENWREFISYRNRPQKS